MVYGNYLYTEKRKNLNSLVDVNTSAINGRAAAIWTRLEKEILESTPCKAEVILQSYPYGDNQKLIDYIQDRRFNCIVSAGGDESINILLNLILKNEQLAERNILLGAIGLGSSNDYHKTHRNYIQGIPVRLDFNNIIKSVHFTLKGNSVIPEPISNKNDLY